MRKCRLPRLCSECCLRNDCPRSVRQDKRNRRTKATTASIHLMKRAACILATGWYSCEGLGSKLYGEVEKTNRTQRMSNMVRARRPINRMKKMGVLAVRPSPKGVAEYTLLPEGLEIFHDETPESQNSSGAD